MLQSNSGHIGKPNIGHIFNATWGGGGSEGEREGEERESGDFNKFSVQPLTLSVRLSSVSIKAKVNRNFQQAVIIGRSSPIFRYCLCRRCPSTSAPNFVTASLNDHIIILKHL